MAINISAQKPGQTQSQPRPQIASALFLVNRSSGAGHSDLEIKELENTFFKQFQSSILHCHCAATADHHQVQQVTQGFLEAFPGPWLLLSGGGSGTTRAQIQAIMDKIDEGAVSPENIYISALRLGSGNIIPKHVGLPKEPLLALSKISEGLHQGHILPCGIYRCVCCDSNGRAQTFYGATMAGIGQIGRVPQDVAYWRQRHSQLMVQLLNHFPLERVNSWQYITFSLLRALKCLIQPWCAEDVAIEQDRSIVTLPLFAGMLINFDFPPLPFHTGCLINEPQLKLCLIPYTNRRQMITALRHWQSLDNELFTYDLTPERPITIHFLSHSQTTLALDEDVFVVPRHIRFEVAPSICFVTGGG